MVPWTQSLDRDANNANTIMSSKLIRTRFHFLCGLISVFNEFAYIHRSKTINLVYVGINGPLAHSVKRGASNTEVLCSRLIRTRFYFLFGLVSLFK